MSYLLGISKKLLHSTKCGLWLFLVASSSLVACGRDAAPSLNEFGAGSPVDPLCQHEMRQLGVI